MSEFQHCCLQFLKNLKKITKKLIFRVYVFLNPFLWYLKGAVKINLHTLEIYWNGK